MPKKKINKKTRGSSISIKGRNVASRAGSNGTARAFGRFVLPMIITLCLLGGLVFLGFMGFRTATASGFFVLRNIDIRGTEKTSKDDVRRIIAASVEKPGVWDVDLSDIKARVEKLQFVKSAAVSRVLPSGIRVNVAERVPAAIVHLSAGDFIIDDAGVILTAAPMNHKDFPFVLYGWDESKTEKAPAENLVRLKVYMKMLDEWKPLDIARHVKEVNLTNPREPVAVVEDSGRAITVTLAKNDLGKSLKRGIDAVSGKGAKVKAVDAAGLYPILQYLEF